ncbi:cyclic nucleotide-binding domain-containing protein [Thiohalorhabdus sp. Cl-TMA]|uniref:Cyclic nucleotide-binding domain-containing protein n=1 Tax=Thiohalorhabdus methylotrophus TaxID=3242694 RepID=A0ABV4TSV6_9GAMM
MQPQHPLWTNLFRTGPDWITEAAELWRRTPLFRDLPKRQCRALTAAMHLRSFTADEPVFRQGDVGAGAVLIRRGRVAIRAGGRDLAELGPGDFFGEVALVAEERRTADAVCLEASELVFFLRPDLEEWLGRAPRHGTRFMSNLAGILATRLRQANHQLADADTTP